MNKKSILLLILCGLILSALMIRNGELVLLAIPFLIYLIIGLVQAPGATSVVAGRFIDKPSVLPQEPFKTRLVIKNQGKDLIHLCLKDDLFPSMTIFEGQANCRVSLQAGEITELSYSSKAPRGVYTWNTIHACASDPFGLFESESSIPALGEVVVRPAPIRIRGIPLKPRFTLRAAGPILARLAGSGTDFWGVREYRAGDSLRRLNWRLAARHPHKLFTNEYQREEIADFGLVLDARRLTNDDATEQALFEYSISAVASLSENFVKSGHRVSLLIFGETLTSLLPGYGKRQLNFILRNLARAKLGGNFPLGYLEYFPIRLFPNHSQIVIVGTLDSRDLETYARLLASGYNILLISPDPVDFASRMLPKTEINSLAIRAARIERAIHAKRLFERGVQVIDWQVTEPLETVIHKATRQLTRGMNVQA